MDSVSVQVCRAGALLRVCVLVYVVHLPTSTQSFYTCRCSTLNAKRCDSRTDQRPSIGMKCVADGVTRNVCRSTRTRSPLNLFQTACNRTSLTVSAHIVPRMRIACVLFSNVSHQLCTNPNEIIDPKQHTIHSGAHQLNPSQPQRIHLCSWPLSCCPKPPPIAVPPKSLADSAPRFKDPNGAGVGISPNSATSPELLDMPCGPVKPSAPPSLTNSATLGKDAPPPTLNENDGSPSSNPEATPGILKRFLSGDPSGVVPWDR